MKYNNRTKQHSASNVTFDQNKVEAYSYGWWKFVSMIEGKVVFNNYRYSNAISGHQAKVRRLMLELNIKIDIEMPVARGLQDAASMYPFALNQFILEAEEYLCDKYLDDELKKQDRLEKQRMLRAERKLQDIALATHAAHESRDSHLKLVKEA